ncbi:MAG: hypothetical protein R6U88_00775 [Candidatus Bipolaricaulota bacterium]
MARLTTFVKRRQTMRDVVTIERFLGHTDDADDHTQACGQYVREFSIVIATCSMFARRLCEWLDVRSPSNGRPRSLKGPGKPSALGRVTARCSSGRETRWYCFPAERSLLELRGAVTPRERPEDFDRKHFARLPGVEPRAPGP